MEVSSNVTIACCPWCGAKLPERRRRFAAAGKGEEDA